MAPTSSSNPEWLCLLQYGSLLSFPLALQAALKLQVFEILSQHGELSAQQIAHLIPSPISNPRAPLLLDHLLRLLSSAAPLLSLPPLLSASASVDPSSQTPITLYSLLPSSKYFLKDDNGVCAGEWMFKQILHVFDFSKHVDVVIREGGDGFERCHGHKISHHVAEHSSSAELQHVMSSLTKLFMTQFLEVYDGFNSVGSVVDVGGSTGSALIHILDRYPHLTGINLDQPHIVAAGITHPRLKHVGGSMFESIPAADAVFMKSILHDWEDEECLKILANCRKALTSEHGKVVVADYCVASMAEDGVSRGHQLDFMMLASHGGKMRTVEEYKKFGKDAGFTDVKVACLVNELVVLEYLV